jgi:FAD/FMN-containing dehydrogenase
VGGFTTGGGYGWTSTKFGLTCDNLVSADVVTASGELVTASESENEDLFWGIRGGGSNFGVVTSFEYKLHPLGPIIHGGMIVFALEQAEDAMAAYYEMVLSAPDELGSAAVMLTAPPEEFVPEHLHGKPVLGFITAWAGDLEDGEKVVAPLKAVGPAVDLVGPIPYRALQSMIDPMAQPGFRNYWRGLHLTDLNEDVIETFLRFPTEGLFPLSFLILFQHGGAVSRVPDEASAFSHRGSKYMLHPIGCWESPADDERHMGWVMEVTEAFEPFLTGGVYINFTPDEGTEVVRAAYSPEKYERLVALKQKYDPDNLFRFNQNIQPALATV